MISDAKQTVIMIVMKWGGSMTIDEAEKIKTVVENKDYVVELVNAVAKTMIEAFENLKIEDVNMFQLGYNKAIDDFVKFASDMPTVEQKDGTIRPMWLKEMAEHLKEKTNDK